MECASVEIWNIHDSIRNFEWNKLVKSHRSLKNYLKVRIDKQELRVQILDMFKLYFHAFHLVPLFFFTNRNHICFFLKPVKTSLDSHQMTNFTSNWRIIAHISRSLRRVVVSNSKEKITLTIQHWIEIIIF
jgi:hypothetical protein